MPCPNERPSKNYPIQEDRRFGAARRWLPCCTGNKNSLLIVRIQGKGKVLVKSMPQRSVCLCLGLWIFGRGYRLFILTGDRGP